MDDLDGLVGEKGVCGIWWILELMRFSVVINVRNASGEKAAPFGAAVRRV